MFKKNNYVKAWPLSFKYIYTKKPSNRSRPIAILLASRCMVGDLGSVNWCKLSVIVFYFRGTLKIIGRSSYFYIYWISIYRSETVVDLVHWKKSMEILRLRFIQNFNQLDPSVYCPPPPPCYTGLIEHVVPLSLNKRISLASLDYQQSQRLMFWSKVIY